MRACSWRCRRLLTKRRVPTGSNCTEQVAGSVIDHHRRARLRLGQRRVRRLRDQVEAGEIGDEREQHAAEHHRLAADPVRQPAEEDVERRADHGHRRSAACPWSRAGTPERRSRKTWM